MPRLNSIQFSMRGGEISRGVRARHDIASYPDALEICQNALPTPAGPAPRRGGFVRLGDAKQASGKAYWVVFRKATNDVVRIELCGGVMRFWDGFTRTPILDGGVPYEISHPWSDDEIPGLYWVQSGDVMVFFHRSALIRTKVLKRTAAASWAISDYVYDDGPFMPRVTPTSLTFDAPEGAVTVTPTGFAFADEHVGALIRVDRDKDDGDISTWQPATTYVAGVTPSYVRHGPRYYRAATVGSSGKSGSSPPLHEIGGAWDGSQINVYWAFEGLTYGIARITGVSPPNAAADVLRRLPFYGAGSANGSTLWQLGAFSDANGYPRAGCINEDRLSVGGNTPEPDTVFLSESQGWTPVSASFNPGLLGEAVDSNAVRRSMADQEVNPIVWMLSLDYLLVGTTGGVKRISGPSSDEPLTPAGAISRTLCAIPCSEVVRPVVTATSFIYAPFHETQLWEVQRTRDATSPRNIAELADHMIAAGIRNMAWRRAPDNALCVLNEEGQLATCTYSPENNMVAWARTVLGGSLDGDWAEIDDICSAPGPYRTEELWIFSRRTINGQTRRYVEYQEREFNPRRMRREDACCLDAAGYFDQWNADPAKTMTLTITNPVTGVGTLGATGHTPFSPGDVGRIIFLRKVKPTPRPSDVAGPVRVRIAGYTNTGLVSVQTVGNFNGALAGQALPQWAFAVTNLTGMTWLEGQTGIRVNADGADYGPFTVTGGTLVPALPEAAARGWVGLASRQHLRSLPLHGGDPNNSARGTMERIDRFYLLVDGAAAGEVRKVGTTEAGINIAGRAAADLMGAAPALASNDVWEELPGGFDRDTQIEFLNETSLPANIAGWVFRTTGNG